MWSASHAQSAQSAAQLLNIFNAQSLQQISGQLAEVILLSLNVIARLTAVNCTSIANNKWKARQKMEKNCS